MLLKREAIFLLFILLCELFCSPVEAKPWWGRRRRRQGTCSSASPSGVKWINDWQQSFTFSCPYSNYLHKWKSIHRNCKEDRLHSFACAWGPASFARSDCAWTHHFVNDYDHPVTFKCKHNGFITGIKSKYSHHHRDRRFAFRCCHISGYVLHNCKITLYMNQWDKPLNYVVPSGCFMTGVHSYHQNAEEDRRWKFEICEVKKVY